MLKMRIHMHIINKRCHYRINLNNVLPKMCYT